MEERRQPTKDHDTLIEMVQILRNHVSNFDSLNKDFREHKIKDEASFESLKKDALATQKIIWMACGATIMVQLLPSLLKIMHILSK